LKKKRSYKFSLYINRGEEWPFLCSMVVRGNAALLSVLMIAVDDRSRPARLSKTPTSKQNGQQVSLRDE
jgi:hypothetical protein